MYNHIVYLLNIKNEWWITLYFCTKKKTFEQYLMLKKLMVRIPMTWCSDIDVNNDNYDGSYTDIDDKLTTTNHLKALKESSEIILSSHDQDNLVQIL